VDAPWHHSFLPTGAAPLSLEQRSPIDNAMHKQRPRLPDRPIEPYDNGLAKHAQGSGTEARRNERHRRGTLVSTLAGLLACGVALVCFFVGFEMAWKLRDDPLLPHGTGAIYPYLIGLAGTVLLTFAIAQAIQVFRLGARDREDLRLWARLTATERRARKQALDTKAIWAFRSCIGATFIVLLTLHSVLWKPLSGSLTALQVEAVALILGTVLIGAFGIKWLRVIRPQDAACDTEQRILTHRWILAAEISTPGSAAFMWFFAVVLIATAARGLMAGHSFLETIVLQALLAAAVLWGAVTETIAVWRRRGKTAPVLRLLREQDQPLVFIGMVDFSQTLMDRAQREACRAELSATYWVYGRWPWNSWFSLEAPVSISRDGQSGTFRLLLDALPPPPSSLIAWSIRVYRPDRKSAALYFKLPHEAFHFVAPAVR
jgi:hypothetical protein